jgi:tRNA-2-methylthio-N6-dimethylallyladenosine synthase
VRLTAEKRALGRIALYVSLKKKLRAHGKTFALVIAGCMAQRMGESLKEKFPEVDYVMGTASRSMFPLILEAVEKQTPGITAFPNLIISEPPYFSFSSSHLEEGEFRSFVPIMHGCNNFCSYCIVPYVRGREISRDPNLIAEEIRLVGERGVREITLLGQNVNTYNWNNGGALNSAINFAGLLRLVAAEADKSGVKRLRFLSANPRDFSQETIRVMAEHRVFCRHLHLCVQHGSNRILQAMNRGYTREHYLALVKDIRSAMPEISLSTDILVGFPGEKEEDIEATLELMEEVRFLYAYMYHYNPREGTAAFDLPDRVSEETKRERLSRVIALQKKHTSALLKKRIGAREIVLVEGISKKNADELITRTERDEMVVAPGPVSMIGSYVWLTLSSLRGNTFRSKEFISCPNA